MPSPPTMNNSDIEPDPLEPRSDPHTIASPAKEQSIPILRQVVVMGDKAASLNPFEDPSTFVEAAERKMSTAPTEAPGLPALESLYQRLRDELRGVIQEEIQSATYYMVEVLKE